jgi:hypothetical protein
MAFPILAALLLHRLADGWGCVIALVATPLSDSDRLVAPPLSDIDMMTTDGGRACLGEI